MYRWDLPQIAEDFESGLSEGRDEANLLKSVDVRIDVREDGSTMKKEKLHAWHDGTCMYT